MEVNRVTRQMIRDIKVDDLEVFLLPTPQACYTARSQVAHVHNLDGYKLKCHVDTKLRKVVIKRFG